jgi:hypothetical protein
MAATGDERRVPRNRTSPVQFETLRRVLKQPHQLDRPANAGCRTLWFPPHSAEANHHHQRLDMSDTLWSTTHCTIKEFLEQVGMSKGTFFPRYRFNPAYAAVLDLKTDRMHRVWIARSAVAVIRAERIQKESHGNRGKASVRVCGFCQHDGHPRHTFCRACGESCPVRQ